MRSASSAAPAVRPGSGRPRLITRLTLRLLGVTPSFVAAALAHAAALIVLSRSAPVAAPQPPPPEPLNAHTFRLNVISFAALWFVLLGLLLDTCDAVAGNRRRRLARVATVPVAADGNATDQAKQGSNGEAEKGQSDGAVPELPSSEPKGECEEAVGQNAAPEAVQEPDQHASNDQEEAKLLGTALEPAASDASVAGGPVDAQTPVLTAPEAEALLGKLLEAEKPKEPEENQSAQPVVEETREKPEETQKEPEKAAQCHEGQPEPQKVQEEEKPAKRRLRGVVRRATEAQEIKAPAKSRVAELRQLLESQVEGGIAGTLLPAGSRVAAPQPVKKSEPEEDSSDDDSKSEGPQSGKEKTAFTSYDELVKQLQEIEGKGVVDTGKGKDTKTETEEVVVVQQEKVKTVSKCEAEAGASTPKVCSGVQETQTDFGADPALSRLEGGTQTECATSIAASSSPMMPEAVSEPASLPPRPLLDGTDQGTQTDCKLEEPSIEQETESMTFDTKDTDSMTFDMRDTIYTGDDVSYDEEPDFAEWDPDGLHSDESSPIASALQQIVAPKPKGKTISNSPMRKWKVAANARGFQRYESRRAELKLIKREIAMESKFEEKGAVGGEPANGRKARVSRQKTLKSIKKIESNTSRSPFGTELEDLTNEGGQILYIPKIIAQFATRFERFTREDVTNVQKLFDSAQPWIQAATDACKEEFDTKGKADLSEVRDSRVVIALFLKFFDMLPSPLIPTALHPQFFACIDGASDEIYASNALLPAVWALPESKRAVLQHILSALRNNLLLSPLADINSVLSVVPKAIGPVFFRVDKTSVTSCADSSTVVKALLMHYERIFLNEGDILYEVAPDGVHALVKQASMRMIIEKVMDQHYREEEFSYNFLLTYQYCLSHTELLSMFNEAYNTVVAAITADSAAWLKRKKDRLVRAICRWVRVRGEELLVDAPEVVTQLCQMFPQSPVTEERTVVDFFQSLRNRENAIDTVIPVSEEDGTKILRELTEQILSEQITALHSHLLCKTPLSEFMRKKKGTKEEATPHLQSLVDACNRLTGWIVSEIVTLEDHATIEKFIKVGINCLRLHNFNAAFAVNVALQHSAVSRLSAWEKVKRSRMSKLTTLRTVFSLDFNSRNYRLLLSRATPPVIPCLIMITKDIFALEENMPTLVTDNRSTALINIEKLRNVGSILADIRRYQGAPYSTLVLNPELAYVLQNARVLPDDVLYRRRSVPLSS